MMAIRHTPLGLVGSLTLALGLFAAQAAAQQPPPAAKAPPPAAPLRLKLAAVLLEQKIKFKDPAGVQRHEFKPKGEDAVKFYDAAGKELCKLTISPEKLKAKTEDDRPLYELKWRTGQAVITDAAGNKELFRLKSKDDGFDLYAGDKLTAVIRKQPAGYAVSDAAGKPLASAVLSGGTAELYEPSGKPRLHSKELGAARALTPLALPGLTPEQQAGLIVYLLCLPQGS